MLVTSFSVLLPVLDIGNHNGLNNIDWISDQEGLSLAEAGDLLSVLMKDPRIRIIEVSEYAALRDFDHGYVDKLVSLFVEGLRRH